MLCRHTSYLPYACSAFLHHSGCFILCICLQSINPEGEAQMGDFHGRRHGPTERSPKSLLPHHETFADDLINQLYGKCLHILSEVGPVYEQAAWSPRWLERPGSYLMPCVLILKANRSFLHWKNMETHFHHSKVTETYNMQVLHQDYLFAIETEATCNIALVYLSVTVGEHDVQSFTILKS